MAIADLKQCDQLCHSCIKYYINKHQLRRGDTFKISCTGIPIDPLPSSILSELNISPELAVAMVDPVVWAAQFLDWHCLDPDGSIWLRKTEDGTIGELPKYNQEQALAGRSVYHRPYQASILRCNARRKVFRIGRQAGKCLRSGTKVQMANGSIKNVENIKNGELVVCYDKNYKSTIAPAYLSSNGTKSIFQVVLSDGRIVYVTKNHPFLKRTNNGRKTTNKIRKCYPRDEWTALEDLNPNDYVAVPHSVKIQSDSIPLSNKKILDLLGILITEGNLCSGGCRVSNSDPRIIERIVNAISDFDCELTQYKGMQKIDYQIVSKKRGTENLVHRWLKDNNLYGCNAYDKILPSFVFQLHQEDIAYLLNIMYSCDGWASINKDNSVEIGYATSSGVLADQIVTLLSRFGIYTDRRIKKVKLNGKIFYSNQLLITRKKDIELFRNLIGIFTKQDRVEKVYQVSQRKKTSYKTDFYEEKDLLFIPIKEINYIGEEQTWDLTIPEYHNFIADNIIVHNTTTLCITMLYHLFTHSGFRIVLLAPYQSQVDLVADNLEALIKGNKMLSNSVKRNVRSPFYQMEIYNGSWIHGFTTGSQSKQEAGSARGQTANMLIFDEADMMSPKDIDAALAIITNFPDASVLMSSTPTGKREKFYQTCHSPLFREFHYSSKINPNWTQELDDLYREQLTEDGYKHEIEGLFGEQEEGVYQNRYIELAQSDYSYKDIKIDPTWIYSIGVDWNDVRIGTTISVVGYNPNSNLFYLVDKHIVQRSEYTQLGACEKVAEYNRLWNPFSIYIDAGFGKTQEEVLRKYGFDSIATQGKNHPDSRLATIVKSYDFGGHVETRDLFTKMPINKPAKPFLVENSVRRFETCAFKYPKEDVQYTASLQGYIVKRISPSGVPVYEEQNTIAGDHFLDATNLALVAFTLEKTEFGKPKVESHIKFTGSMNKESLDSIIIKDKNDTRNSIANTHRPQNERNLNSSTSNSFSSNLPLSTHVKTPEKLWDWPGFGHDAPKPTVTPFHQRVNTILKKIKINMPSNRTPHRKKF